MHWRQACFQSFQLAALVGFRLHVYTAVLYNNTPQKKKNLQPQKKSNPHQACVFVSTKKLKLCQSSECVLRRSLALRYLGGPKQSASTFHTTSQQQCRENHNPKTRASLRVLLKPFSKAMVDTISAICARCVKDGEAALASVPSRVEGMQILLDSKFSYTNLKDVERQVWRESCVRDVLSGFALRAWDSH